MRERRRERGLRGKKLERRLRARRGATSGVVVAGSKKRETPAGLAEIALSVPARAPGEDRGHAVDVHALHFVVRVEHQRVAPQRDGPQDRTVGVREGGLEEARASRSAQDLPEVRGVGVVAKVDEEVVVLDDEVLVRAVGEDERRGGEVVRVEHTRVLRRDELRDQQPHDAQREAHLVRETDGARKFHVIAHARRAGGIAGERLADGPLPLRADRAPTRADRAPQTARSREESRELRRAAAPQTGARCVVVAGGDAAVVVVVVVVVVVLGEILLVRVRVGRRQGVGEFTRAGLERACLRPGGVGKGVRRESGGRRASVSRKTGQNCSSRARSRLPEKRRRTTT